MGRVLDSVIDDLNLLLHDRLFAEQGVQECYWDTSDVRNTLLGHAAYYSFENLDDGKRIDQFDGRAFNDDRALVHALKAASFFGPIRLLQPHQAEIYKLINEDFHLPAGVPIGGFKQFIRDCGVQGFGDIELEDLLTMPPNRLAAMINMQAGSAANLFKVIQSIRLRSWRHRLLAWTENKKLLFESDTYSYASYTTTELFVRIQTAFNEERPRYATNNLADAIALCQLVEKLHQYHQGKTKALPRFYLTPTHEKALKRADLLDPVGPFGYEFDGTRYTVFRSSNYYKLWATMKSLDSGPFSDRGDSSLSDLMRARDELVSIRKAQRPLTDEILTKIHIGKQTVREIVERLEKFWFLESVWLPYSAAREVLDVIEEYQELIKVSTVDPHAYRTAIGAQVEKAMAELNQQSQGFHRISRVWTGLDKALQRHEKVLSEHSHLGIDLYVLSGIVRFGFSEPALLQIRETLSALVSSILKMKNQAMLDVFVASQEVASGHLDMTRCEYVAGVFWALHMDEWITDNLGALCWKNQCPYSVRIVLAASIFRNQKFFEVTLGEKVIDELEREFANAASTEEKAALAVGLGYLHFHHLERRMSGSIRWSESLRLIPLKKAAKCAADAVDMLPDWSERRAYAANQCLFYMLQVPKGFGEKTISNAASILQELLGTEFWQYRFSDTLAHYFEFLASTEDDPKEKVRCLELAMRELDRALELGGVMDPDVMKSYQRVVISRREAKRLGKQ